MINIICTPDMYWFTFEKTNIMKGTQIKQIADCRLPIQF